MVRFRIIVNVCIFSVLFSTLALSFPTNQSESGESYAGELDGRISKMMDKYKIPGVLVAVLDQGNTIWQKAYGFADLESGRKMTIDSRCRVESISKSVTAWGVMKLVQEARIALDDPVHQYLHSWNFPPSDYDEQGITIRQLLNNTAGMPLGEIGVRYSPESENIPTLRESLSENAVLFQEPGESFSYGNTAYHLLELLIEEVTGRDFSEYMDEEIFTPLGMSDAGFRWESDWDPPVPLGYTLQGKPVPVYIYPEKGSGGLFATIEDVTRFVAAGMPDFSTGQPVLSPESIRQMYKGTVDMTDYYQFVFDSYGLGYFVETLPNGMLAVSHGGQGTGWMTQFYAIPEAGAGIVLLTNSQRSWPFFAHILADWSRLNHIPAVGMTRIILAQRFIWAVIGGLILSTLWLGGSVVNGLISGRRKPAPFQRTAVVPRALLFLLSAGFLFAILWANGQEYFFLSSVFPVATPWLGLSMLLFSISGIIFSISPVSSK